jgi:signal-transduction protein with cAMP-binding, CBS, and nucleotidyltransferase domain
VVFMDWLHDTAACFRREEMTLIDPTVNQMKRYGVIGCPCSASLLDAARLMNEEDISALVVLDKEGYLQGIISRTDLLRAKTNAQNWMVELVENWMSKEVVTVESTDHLSKVARLLLQHQIHRVVAVQEENGKIRPVAVISDADIIYHMTKEQYFMPNPNQYK